MSNRAMSAHFMNITLSSEGHPQAPDARIFDRFFLFYSKWSMALSRNRNWRLAIYSLFGFCPSSRTFQFVNSEMLVVIPNGMSSSHHHVASKCCALSARTLSICGNAANLLRENITRFCCRRFLYEHLCGEQWISFTVR